jgi:hypothetical protein
LIAANIPSFLKRAAITWPLRGQILKTLDDPGESETTINVFAGDNHCFLGEHGLSAKRFAYEASMRIPFIFYFPKMIKPGTVREELVQNLESSLRLSECFKHPVRRHGRGDPLSDCVGDRAGDQLCGRHTMADPGGTIAGIASSSPSCPFQGTAGNSPERPGRFAKMVREYSSEQHRSDPCQGARPQSARPTTLNSFLCPLLPSMSAM